MKLKGSAYSLIVIMVLMLVVIAASLRMEEFQAKMLPITYGIIGFVLAAIGLTNELTVKKRTKVTTTGDKTGEAEQAEESGRGLLMAGTWIVGLFLGLYLLGIMLALPIYFFSYMKTHGVSWLTTIVFTIVIPAFIYILFVVVLEVRLHPGLIFIWLGLAY